MRLVKQLAGPVRLAAVIGLAFGLVGLVGPAASASSARPAHAHDGWIRLAHLSPNTPAVDVYLYSFGNPSARIVLKHVTYGTVSPYQAVPSGEYTVAMRGAGAPPSSKPVLSTTVNVTTGKTYTVAGMGPNSGLRLQILNDKLVTPPGKALVRVIQASLQQHKVTVSAGSNVLVHNLAFGDVTSYQTVSPGTWNVRAAGASDSATESIKLSAGTIHTIVVLDDPGHLALDNLVDAAGSRVVPAAPRPPASAAPRESPGPRCCRGWSPWPPGCW